MDSTRIVKTFDTTISNNDTLVKHFVTVESTPDCGCSKNLCDCKLVSDLIWPLTILIIIGLFYKKLSKLIDIMSGRVKRLKFGSFEVELDELRRQAEKVESTVAEVVVPSEDRKTKEPAFTYTITSDLPLEILKLSLEIEKTLSSIYDLTAPKSGKKPLGVRPLATALSAIDILDNEQTDLLTRFWSFRNNIVHNVTHNLPDNEIMSFVDIGIKILHILKIIQRKYADETMDR